MKEQNETTACPPPVVFVSAHQGLPPAHGAVPRSLTAEYRLVNTPGLCQDPTNDFSAQIKWSEDFLMAATELHDSFQENLQK